MRTQLPTMFAELTVVSRNVLSINDDIVETVGNFLIKEIRNDQITAINSGGETVDFLLYSDYIDQHPRVANIKFLSDEDDDYQDFVIGIQHNDMTRAIENLADLVKAEFDQILSVCPFDYYSLSEMLRTQVLNSNETQS